MPAALFVMILGNAMAADNACVVKREFIFDKAPFASCHASTIAETAQGRVAAWFGGRGEGKPDVGIWLSRHENGRWTAPAEVAQGTVPGKSRYPCWNPVLFQPRAAEGKAPPLMLFYKVGPSPQKWWGMHITSDDCGKTWSPPRRLADGVLGPIKNKPVQLADGDLLCPTSIETTDRPSRWRIYFERTADLGKTWTRTEFLNDGKQIQAVQPSILALGPKRLMAVARTRQGKILQAVSDDAGKTWGRVELGPLPNPNSGIDAVTLKDGRQLLVYNHTASGRWPLNVAVSSDGSHWRQAAVLEALPGEYSYPAVIQSADGLVHITYTWLRLKICHVTIDPAKIPAGSETEKKQP